MQSIADTAVHLVKILVGQSPIAWGSHGHNPGAQLKRRKSKKREEGIKTSHLALVADCPIKVEKPIEVYKKHPKGRKLPED